MAVSCERYHILYQNQQIKLFIFIIKNGVKVAYNFDLSRRPLQYFGHPEILTHSRLVRMEEAPNTETKISRNVKKTREVNTQEALEYLQRPIPKISDPNKALKKAYEKGHLDDSKFEFLKELKDLRSKKKDDSVSSHGATDDEDFNITQEKARKISKQTHIQEDQSAERPQKKKRKIRFAVKIQKPVLEQNNEEDLEKQDEIDSEDAKKNIPTNEENYEKQSQQIESKSTERMQQAIQSAVVVQPKQRKISKSTGRRTKKVVNKFKRPQDDIPQTNKKDEEKIIQSESEAKQIPNQEALQQPNSQVWQTGQAEVPKVKQKAAQSKSKKQRLTRQSVMQTEMRKEQQMGRNLKPEGRNIIKSRTKSRQTRVKFEAKDEDLKKPVQRRRRNKQQTSLSKPKKYIQEPTQVNLQTQPDVPSNTQEIVVTKRRRAARRTNRQSNNTEKAKRSSNSRSRSKITSQSKIVRDQTQPKQAHKTPEPDKQGRLSINSKVVIESLNFFELKRRTSKKEKKKHAKKYYIQSQSDDEEEYPMRRHKANKAKRYRKICIEESDDSSDDIVERKRKHSRKNKQRRKRQHSSSDDMSEVSESHVFRTKQRHYRSRDPKEQKFELKQEHK